MFGYALRHPKLPASNGIVNLAGLTPLTLACKLGRAEVFREMLELSAREFWRYSNITCSAYPLNALDTLLPDGRTSKLKKLLLAVIRKKILMFHVYVIDKQINSSAMQWIDMSL
jgi:hypothetical protein